MIQVQKAETGWSPATDSFGTKFPTKSLSLLKEAVTLIYHLYSAFKH